MSDMLAMYARTLSSSIRASLSSHTQKRMSSLPGGSLTASARLWNSMS